MVAVSVGTRENYFEIDTLRREQGLNPAILFLACIPQGGRSEWRRRPRVRVYTDHIRSAAAAPSLSQWSARCWPPPFVC